MFMMSMQAKVSEPAAADDKILVVSKSDELALDDDSRTSAGLPTWAESKGKVDAASAAAAAAVGPVPGSALTLHGVALAAMRRCLLSGLSCIDAAHGVVRDLQQVPNRSTRANFLRTLPELIGPPPAHSWTDEWAALQTDFLKMEDDPAVGRQLAEMTPDECAEYIDNSPIYSLETVMSDGERIIEELVAERQWERQHAEAYSLLYPLRAPLSKALAERRSDYAASIYALSEALAAAGALAGQRSAPLLPVYKHLHGPNGLIEADEAWSRLLEPDNTGFRGLTSSALVVATRDRRCFTPDGFRNGTVDDDSQPRYDLMDSDVVCIEASPADATAFHSAVMINDLFGALPPNTLFRLKRVVQPGEWEVAGVKLESEFLRTFQGTPGGQGGGAGGGGASSGATAAAARPRTPLKKQGTFREKSQKGHHEAQTEVNSMVRPMQRLLVVSCTFRPPKDPEERPLDVKGGASSGKFGVHVNTLMYASREAYIAGLDDILAQPSLSLAQEFERDLSWEDFRGDQFSLRSEWQYVMGPASPSTTSEGRKRDWENRGKIPEDFVRDVNAKIHQRRERAKKASRKDFDVSLTMLPEETAYLTLEEVLAVRLYSGPAFQPINEFLRQVGRLTGDFRKEVAHHPHLTFAATVKHIVDAIRKLAAVTSPREASQTLYRGVRGELPRAFWYEDRLGMITAVDAAFMSTSMSAETPLEYMRGKHNVLWTLHPQMQSDAAYHRGADISLLSQFASEREVLFPPCSMLIVQTPPAKSTAAEVETPSMAARSRSDGALALTGAQQEQALPPPPTSSSSGTRFDSAEQNRNLYAKYEQTADGKAYVKLHVLPCFV